MPKLTLTRTSSAVSGLPLKPPPGYIPLIQFLRETEDLQARHLLQISCSLSEQLKDIHATGFALGGINFDHIFVSNQVSN